MKIILNNFEKDQLLEVVSIGAGNASTALSRLVGERVAIMVPEMVTNKIIALPKIIGESNKLNIIIPASISGDILGTLFLIFSQQGAHHLTMLLTKKSFGEIKQADNLEISAFREINNILAGAYLMALSRFLNINMIHCVMARVTTESMLASLGEKSAEALFFKINFFIESKNINGQFFLILDSHSTARIIDITKHMTSLKKTNYEEIRR